MLLLVSNKIVAYFLGCYKFWITQAVPHLGCWTWQEAVTAPLLSLIYGDIDYLYPSCLKTKAVEKEREKNSIPKKMAEVGPARVPSHCESLSRNAYLKLLFLREALNHKLNSEQA